MNESGNYQRREKLRLEILETASGKEHFHQDVELLYVLSGGLDVMVDGKKTCLSQEDVLIINPGKRHCLKNPGDVLYIKLTILYDLLRDILNQFDIVFVCDSVGNSDPAYDGLRKLLQQLLEHYLTSKGRVADFAHIAKCYQIMDYICVHFLIRTADVPEGQEKDKYQNRIRQIDNYINANYRSTVSMKELSEKLYLSSGYLSRFFKKNYGMSFPDYLMNVRLHHVVEELLYTDIPITRIIYDNGFSSVAIFNKAFKQEYGETPSAMRKRVSRAQKQEQFQLSEDLQKKLENVLWNDIRGMDMNASQESCMELSVKAPRPLDFIWNKIINIGAAEDLLRSEVQEHVLMLRDQLKFTYVRFWNPFSKEMLIDINSPDHKYNFSRLDSILDFLIRCRIRPFIELGNKPRRLAKTATSSVIYDIFESIALMDSWSAVMEAFIIHIVNRYGREEVRNWKFELWFDVDHLKDDIHILSYSELFKTAQSIIHKYSDAMIGGCGMHVYVKRTEKKAFYIRAFYEKMLEKATNPDFITMYSYSYDSRDEGGTIVSSPSSDSEFVTHAIENFKKDVGNAFAGKELYLSEWNLTFSDRNLINDTCFKGAYIMKNYIDLVGKVNGVAYFRGTDRVSESYDTDDFLFGGAGLLTREGIQKPAAFAIHFLNRLYPMCIGKGNNYLATADGHGNYGIACHNCKKLSYRYYYVEEDQLDRDHLNKYYEDMNELNLMISLTDVKDGNYQMKIYRINDQNGSVQKSWMEMGYEKNLSRDDIRYIQRVCEPRLTIQKVRAENKRLPVSINMAANEIAFISLQYAGNS